MNPADYISRPTHVELTEAAGPQTFDSEEQTNIEVYKKGIPSVVNITSTAVAFDFFYGPVPQEGQGSGFIIDKEGHILTNYHVIANAREVEVTLHNKKKYKATVIGRDRSHDLAVIQIKAPDLVAGHAGRFEIAGRRAKSVCHRQSLRTERHHDARHHQLGASHSHARRGRDRRGHPDRRCHQSRETPAARC